MLMGTFIYITMVWVIIKFVGIAASEVKGCREVCI